MREAAAALLEGSPTEADDANVGAVLRATRETAEQAARLVDEFLNNYAAHFNEIGCPPEEFIAYFQHERRTLGSLYSLAVTPIASPLELQRLALRFALDARRPVEGFPDFFDVHPTTEGCRVVRMGSPLERFLPASPGARGRLIQKPYANHILTLVFQNPPDVCSLVSAIEGIFRTTPTKADTLEATSTPQFTYEIVRHGTRPFVRLFLGAREVDLPNWRHVHKLLFTICHDSDAAITTREFKVKYGVSNASQAAAQIRKALGAIGREAHDWLLTRPRIRWAEGRAPAPHVQRQVPAKDKKR